MTIHARSSIDPARGAFIITPNDDIVLDTVTRAISIGTAGDLRVRFTSGDIVTIPANALAIGIQHAMAIEVVYSTGTTADEIVGWY